MKKLIVALLGLSALLMAELKTIDADTLIKMQAKGVPVIDIRTPQEWKERGVIKGAHLMMFFDEQGRPHIKEWMQGLSKLIKDKKSPFILYCAHANRTKALGSWLSDKAGFTNVYQLKGGIEYGWIEEGKPVVKPEN